MLWVPFFFAWRFDLYSRNEFAMAIRSTNTIDAKSEASTGIPVELLTTSLKTTKAQRSNNIARYPRLPHERTIVILQIGAIERRFACIEVGSKNSSRMRECSLCCGSCLRIVIRLTGGVVPGRLDLR